MGFSKVLYYPSIDIENENWLKSAVLFWDEINTIVPESMGNPYQNNSTRYLSDEGILKPIKVNPLSEYANKVQSKIWLLLDSDAGKELLRKKTGEEKSLHKHKLAASLIYRLMECGAVENTDEMFLKLNPVMVDFYMTLLANEISEDKALSLVADDTLQFRFADVLRRENRKEIGQSILCGGSEDHVAQGMLTNLVMKNIRISETTSLDDVLAFRRKHQDELGRFRKNLGELVKTVEDVPSFEAFQETITTIYQDEFLPAYNDLEKALNASAIKWVSDNVSKLCMTSMSTTAIPVLMGLNMPQSILLGAGVTIISSAISYNIDKKKKLRENPYTYLLEINQNI